MNRNLLLSLTMLGTLGLVATNASATNIALNSDVTLNGDFFSGQGSWTLGTNGTPASIVDGIFLPEGQQWNYGSVWWSTNHEVPGGQYITVDLGGIYNVNSFIMQADNNDGYKIEYFDLGALEYVSIAPIGGWGLTTRPELTLASTITTSSFRLSAVPGDGYYSISEFQAFGEAAPVPEPATMLLLGTGIAGLAGSRLRRKKNN